MVIQGYRSWCQSKAHIRLPEFLLSHINGNFGRISYTVFEILTFKARKWLVFCTPPLFDAPVGCGR